MAKHLNSPNHHSSPIVRNKFHVRKSTFVVGPVETPVKQTPKSIKSEALVEIVQTISKLNPKRTIDDQTKK